MTKNYFVLVSVTVKRTSGFEIGFKTVDIDLVVEIIPITEWNYPSFKDAIEKVLPTHIASGEIVSFQIKNISAL